MRGRDEMGEDFFVLFPMQEKRVCRLTVASRSADLLVVGDEVLRKLEMNDETDVRLVIPHAQLHGGGKHPGITGHEACEVLLLDAHAPFVFPHAGVIGKNRHPPFGKEICDGRAIGMRETVDYSLTVRENLVSDQHLSEPSEPLFSGLQRIDLDCQVLSNEVAPDYLQVAAHLLLDVGDNPIVGRGGRSQDGDVAGQAVYDLRDALVVRPKVVSPVRYRVGFVDHHQLDSRHLGQMPHELLV